jgi:hypothetical protein
VSAAIGLTLNITKPTSTICDFVLKVNDAQRDLDLVRAEVSSIKYALRFLTTAGSGQMVVPSQLEYQVSGALDNIGDIIRQIEACIVKQMDMRLSKRVRWAISERADMDKLRTSLEAHKSGLDLTLDLLSL